MDDASVTEAVSTDAPASTGDNIQNAHINNAVLFYVQYASGRSVRINLLKVLDTTFTEEEMGNAKYIIWGLAGEDLLGKIYPEYIKDPNVMLHGWILLMHIVKSTNQKQ